MRIAYAYQFDAARRMTQSGYPHAILSQCRRLGHDVVPAFPLRTGLRRAFAWKQVAYRMLGLTYRPDREPVFLRDLARQVQKRLNAHPPIDCVVAPGSHAIAELPAGVPVVLTADATFAGMLDFYPDYSRCAREYIAAGHRQERLALTRCAAAIFPSEWAAESAHRSYGLDRSRIHVIPWGANVADPGWPRVRDWIATRSRERLRLLFVGREWARKGAAKVLATCEVLRQRAIDVELDLVGIERPPVALPPYARSHALLNRDDPEQRRRLDALFARAHFLFVPSEAEAYGLVFCEAAAFGVPSLATRVGGIPSIVQHDVTGFTLGRTEPPEAFADVLSAGFRSHERYLQMAEQSYRTFRERLNWDAFGRQLQRTLATVVAERPNAYAGAAG